jgi:hypothetical protein
MLQDRPGECIIKNEFTAAAVEYLNQFPMFKEEKKCYIIRGFYNYCFGPNKFKCDIFDKYLNNTDNSQYHWYFNCGDDVPVKPLNEQFTLEDARRFIQAIKALWMSYCIKENREVNWFDELPVVPKGLLSIPSNICLE